MLLAVMLAAAPPAFDPLRFFTGRTRGTAELKAILHARQPVAVRGTGAIQPDGSLSLDQVVQEGDKPSRMRHWRLRRVAPGRYTGTLTDARGPVDGVVTGDRMQIDFTSTGGFRVSQSLTLAPDGRSLSNRLVAKRFGIKVAVLTERIEKLD
ncbi:hypothetical protein ASE95_10535 [Sphingomonas sp. Leaf231]|uniref:DUF3833 family protein n=1 Tax=Sphingomonas sp. Leaf231 TaxID=1736301 RepID=UPI0006F64257|nr:DUF3833 family protein [Sphingomonas sp. Leaf231]KQN93013.1 hypothetical protein ASE95_10535 [Sphingomonas sp. Leaf231]